MRGEKYVGPGPERAVRAQRLGVGHVQLAALSRPAVSSASSARWSACTPRRRSRSRAVLHRGQARDGLRYLLGRHPGQQRVTALPIRPDATLPLSPAPIDVPLIAIDADRRDIDHRGSRRGYSGSGAGSRQAGPAVQAAATLAARPGRNGVSSAASVRQAPVSAASTASSSAAAASSPPAADRASRHGAVSSMHRLAWPVSAARAAVAARKSGRASAAAVSAGQRAARSGQRRGRRRSPRRRPGPRRRAPRRPGTGGPCW